MKKYYQGYKQLKSYKDFIDAGVVTEQKEESPAIGFLVCVLLGIFLILVIFTAQLYGIS